MCRRFEPAPDHFLKALHHNGSGLFSSLAAEFAADPESIELVDGFTRDVRDIGHWGTGDLEITLKTGADLEKALPLLQASYDAS